MDEALPPSDGTRCRVFYAAVTFLFNFLALVYLAGFTCLRRPASYARVVAVNPARAFSELLLADFLSNRQFPPVALARDSIAMDMPHTNLRDGFDLSVQRVGRYLCTSSPCNPTRPGPLHLCMERSRVSPPLFLSAPLSWTWPPNVLRRTHDFTLPTHPRPSKVSSPAIPSVSARHEPTQQITSGMYAIWASLDIGRRTSGDHLCVGMALRTGRCFFQVSATHSSDGPLH